MIRVEFRNYDCDKFWKNYPEVELSLDGNGYHAAYLANLFRDFMLSVGYTENTVDDYIPPIERIESHIEHKLQENFKKILEKSTKVSEESADNNTSAKNKSRVYKGSSYMGDLENIKAHTLDKCLELKLVETVYLDMETQKLVFGGTNVIPLTERDFKTVVGHYNRYKMYTIEGGGCVGCTIQKLSNVERDFNKFLVKIRVKYFTD
jgi:hypothetical protein